MGKTKYNYAKLRGRIVEKFGTIVEFSAHTSKKRASITNILNNKQQLSQSDIEEWANLLEINDNEIGLYFFAQ